VIGSGRATLIPHMPCPEPRGGNETARVHQTSRRCGGDVAAFRTGAATSEAAYYWLSWYGHTFRMEPMGRSMRMRFSVHTGAAQHCWSLQGIFE
jgi:hypothetical protein